MGNRERDPLGCICFELEQVLYEQNQISGSEFQYVSNPFGMDTIPLILYHSSNCHKPFKASCFNNDNCLTSMFFRIEHLDLDTCCAVFSLLKPVDMDGCQVDCDDLYTLVKTGCCIKVDLSCIFAFTPLPPKIVNRALPIIEPKC
ncbi:CotY/CotZ family spore coat protein [Bacillus sp. Marseille-P3661]|uniref:CotY/CotZ family spore coat protein n=1 Tax=Bacillus sp. Marseille-P3661 TaxID=1936234 RepID=UPI000C84AF06|nr:CotY/CotZ family spore coat protein [Bacillus sp. Marseille-P3661]